MPDEVVAVDLESILSGKGSVSIRILEGEVSLRRLDRPHFIAFSGVMELKSCFRIAVLQLHLGM